MEKATCVNHIIKAGESGGINIEIVREWKEETLPRNFVYLTT